MVEERPVLNEVQFLTRGNLVFAESPLLFLKNTFGAGYRLTIAKNNDFKEDLFISILQLEIDQHVIETNIAAEMCVSIPFGMSTKLPALLSNIENNKKVYGIDGYGISSPTIEEVFIK